MWVDDVVADRFVVERPIGSGGMGSVFLARDRQTEQAVAVKVLDLATEPAIERFRREARVLSELAHPGIVRYVAHGETETNELYFVMEYLDGEDLAHRILRSPLTVAESLTVATEIAEALAFAHARGVVHRDVKPSNVFLVQGNSARVKLLDFGIARPQSQSTALTRSGAMLGTVGYMAPEQAMGESNLDARVDVFALGCVLFECLTGRPAFSGDHMVAVLAKVLCEEAPRVSEIRPGLDALDGIVASLLAKSRDDRPRDAAAALALLRASRSGIRDVATEAPPVPQGVTGSERRIVSVILAEPVSAATSETLTPGEAHRQVTNVHALADRFGAQATPLAGGAWILVLSARGEASDRARHAASCALRLRALDADLRIVLATGWGDTTGQLPVGPVIDRAASLLRAPDNLLPSVSIAIDSVTGGLLGSRFDVESARFGYVLTGERLEFEQPRLLLGKVTPCVGRDKELALLDATLEECVTDSVARSVVVMGPPGIGKSRLASEFCARVQKRTGIRLVAARADEVSAGSSLALAHRLVRQAADLPESVPLDGQCRRLQAWLDRIVPADQRQRLLEFLGEIVGVPTESAPSPLLRAARNDPSVMREQKRRAFETWVDAETAAAPLLVVLDDLHWGDLPTVNYFDELLTRFGRRGFMVLGLARPEVQERFPGLWGSVGAQSIRLGGLTARASERLARAVLGDVDSGLLDRVVERSDGNAFYLEELLRRVAEGGQELPETVFAMLQSRLEGLEPEARRVLRAGSVFGETLWRGGVASILGGGIDPTDWLETLADRELLVRSRTCRFSEEMEYRFRHALLRDAAYATLTDRDRPAAHFAAANWLERAGEHDALAMAAHFEQSSAPERSIPWWARSAQASLEGGNLQAVLTSAEKAVSRGAAGETLGTLRVSQGLALGWMGEWAPALNYAVEGMALVRSGSAPWVIAGGAICIAGSATGNVAAISNLVGELAKIGAQPTGPYALATAHIVFGLVYTDQTAMVPVFIAQLDRADTGTQDPDPAFRGWLDIARAFEGIYVSRGFERARRTVVRGERLLEQAGDSLGRCVALATATWAHSECGDFPAGLRVAQECSALAESRGMPWLSDWGKFFRCRALAHSTPRAWRDEAPSITAAIVDPLMRSLRRSAIAQCKLALGDVERAENEARAVLAENVSPIPVAMSLGAMARIHLSRGEPADALSLAERGCALDVRGAAMPLDGSTLNLARFEALEALGRKDDAREALRSAVDRILGFAAKFDDPEQRETYLSAIEPNARTLSLGRALLVD